MELWTTWTNILESALGLLTTHFGFSEAAAIIILTFIARLALMPLSIGAAYRAQKNKMIMANIKPSLEELRVKFKDNPQELTTRTMALYREKGVKFLDKKTVLNIFSQTVFGLGVFKVLKRVGFHSKFYWIADLGKPDILLTIIVGVLMAAGIAFMPESSGSSSMWIMIAIPVLISIFAVATLPSSIGIYWATSNPVTVGQTLALRGILAHKRNLHNAPKTGFLKK